MSSKVKCTCGWSWNKSDSSKKDMYICHECGRDNSNNMKNGGWLDNYGEEENANESSVSLPDGYVGMGNDTKGRNSSPAWGGQFQDGGSVYPVNYVPQTQIGKELNDKITKERLENYVDNFLGNPQAAAKNMSRLNPDGFPIDNLRHSFAGRYTQNAISKKLGNGLMANVAGLVGSNVLGAAHEISRLSEDKIPLLTKIRESGEDMFNNAVGSVVGAIPYMDEKAKDKMMYKLSFGNLLPDGYVSTEKGRKEGQSENIYFKNQKGKIERKYQMGGNLPGAVGFSYARTNSPAPSEGKYAKKTMASAKNGRWLDSYEDGGVIKDDRGQWDHPGEITEIGSNDITMEGVPYDVLGISDTGDTKLMKPGKNYKFKGKKVTEYPMAKNGLRQEQKGLQNLDNLTNFTNYNTKQPGGWLDNL